MSAFKRDYQKVTSAFCRYKPKVITAFLDQLKMRKNEILDSVIFRLFVSVLNYWKLFM